MTDFHAKTGLNTRPHPDIYLFGHRINGYPEDRLLLIIEYFMADLAMTGRERKRELIEIFWRWEHPEYDPMKAIG